jgi:hypothetical protein
MAGLRFAYCGLLQLRWAGDTRTGFRDDDGQYGNEGPEEYVGHDKSNDK